MENVGGNRDSLFMHEHAFTKIFYNLLACNLHFRVIS